MCSVTPREQISLAPRQRSLPVAAYLKRGLKPVVTKCRTARGRRIFGRVSTRLRRSGGILRLHSRPQMSESLGRQRNRSGKCASDPRSEHRSHTIARGVRQVGASARAYRFAPPDHSSKTQRSDARAMERLSPEEMCLAKNRGCSPFCSPFNLCTVRGDVEGSPTRSRAP